MSVAGIFDIDSRPVTPFAHIWQTSGAARLFGRDSFSILGYSHSLQVIRLVERTVYGPVVRDTDLFPSGSCI